MPLHMLTAFGIARFDRTYARLNVVSTIGTAGGPVVLGLMHDAFGGYRPALGVLAAGSGTAVVLLLIARIDTAHRWRRRSAPQQTSVS
jgi:multisubunit Na+/H+ antiporter MnhG subunit